MPEKNWYVHISGETFGPLSSDVVALMLQQNRLQFSDFVWSEGMTKWIRLSEIHTFAAYLPQYPTIPFPEPAMHSATEESHDVVEEAPEEVYEAPEAVEAEPEPEPAPRPALRAVPSPAPKPKAAPAPAPAPAKARPAAAAATAAAPAPAKKAPAPAPVAKAATRTQVVLERPQGNVRRQWRVPIDAAVKVEGFGYFKVLDISEGGCLLEATEEIAVGADLKLRIESESFPKPLDMTALLVRQETFDGKRSYGIEFTKVNPAHRRTLAAYVKSKLSMNNE